MQKSFINTLALYLFTSLSLISLYGMEPYTLKNIAIKNLRKILITKTKREMEGIINKLPVDIHGDIQKECLQNPFFTFQAHESYVRSIDFSPDGKYLASAANRKINLWKTDKLSSLILMIEDHKSYVNCVKFHPFSNLLASASDDGKVMLRKIDSEELNMLNAFTNQHVVDSVCFSECGDYLIYTPGNVVIQNLKTKEETRFPGRYHCGLNNVFFKHSYIAWLAIGGIILWDIRTPKISENLIHCGKTNENTITSFVFSKCGRYIFSSTGTKKIYIFDLFTQKVKCKHKSYREDKWIEKRLPYSMIIYNDVPSRCICVDPMLNHLAVGSSDGTVTIWDISNIEKPVLFKKIQAHKSDVYSIAFSPDGKLIASGAKDGTISIINVELIEYLNNKAILKS